ncbi:MAG: LemA family protein [Sphingomonadales bacterium]
MSFDRRLALLAPLAAVSLAGCGINSVPTAEENAKAKWANVQADYQRRADLIPNLVATVKGFAKQEEKVLTQVTQARAAATSTQLTPEQLNDPARVKAFQEAQGAVTAALVNIRNITEAYPDLKSNANFLALQSQLEGTENRINISVKDYNEAVQAYNTRIRTFPDAIGAKVFYGAKPMTTYTATAPNADRAPTVDFN